MINANLELENENYQLQLLKSQLNPHFLFNSLNSLKGLVYLDRKVLALKYTDKLSAFLRSVLSSQQGLECILRDELGVIEHYIQVEYIRLADKIQWKVQCDENLIDKLIPSNILQPVMENSVKYAYDPKNEYLAISLTCLRNEDELWLIIEDNGPGPGLAKNKNSFSLEAIRKRIDKFNRGSISDCLTLSEIVANNKIVGTRTTIKIKIYEDTDFGG